MIKFEDIHKDVANVLEKMGIGEENLFNHYSDLYVGCDTIEQARELRDSGKWKSMSSIFTPQKGSDMEHFKFAVDIGLAYVQYYHQRNY